jgi:hypothetical protein
MRVDSSSTNSNSVNPYNAATEKTAAARRSFQPRKKPVKRAASVQAWTGVDKASMMGQWMSGGRSQALTKIQRHASAPGKDSKIA